MPRKSRMLCVQEGQRILGHRKGGRKSDASRISAAQIAYEVKLDDMSNAIDENIGEERFLGVTSAAWI